MDQPSRRLFLKSAGATALTTATHAPLAANRATHQHAGVKPDQSPRAYTFFNPREARFIEAAVARLIPSDETGPGAIEADVPGFLDKQLGGGWGAGERLFRSGPWPEGTPSQGYQLPFTPAELFRTAMRGIEQDLAREHHNSFDKLPPLAQDTYLTQLQNGERDLGDVPSKVFFESLWSMTLEGFFADPVYGGNREMVAWKMIGFPGAYANYYELIDQHGVAFHQAPMSLSQSGRGHIQIHPDTSGTPGKRG